VTELRLAPWKRYGHDRLYVNLADGESVAWLDRRTGRVSILAERYREEALRVLAPHLGEDGAAPGPAAAPSLPRTAVSTPPVPTLPPAPASRTAASTPSVPASREAASPPPVSAPAAVASAAVPPPVPPLLPPEYDLARNRPGAALRPQIDRLSPSRFARLLARLRRRPHPSDSWRRGLAGERKVGAELERLASAGGWRVLHSIPVAEDRDIDHLLIGPGGVFCLNTKHHPKKAVWVGDDSVRIDHGDPRPYVRRSRGEARHAARTLTHACGFPVHVHPVLVFVAPSRLHVVPTLHDVLPLRPHDLPALTARPAELPPETADRIYAAARDARTWRRG
jgi:Nuclease-related domain